MEENKKAVLAAISAHKRLCVQAFFLERRIDVLGKNNTDVSRKTIHDPYYFPGDDDKKKTAKSSLKRVRKEIKEKGKEIAKLSKECGMQVKVVPLAAGVPRDVFGDPELPGDADCRYRVFVIERRSLFHRDPPVRSSTS